ncbi:MAG: AMP-binding protein [Thermoleophilia bacterium]
MLATSRALAPGAADRAVAVSGPAGGLTRAQLIARAAALGARSAGWSEHGDARSPYIGLVSDWTPDFVAAFCGLAAAGWAVGVIDPLWSADEAGGAVAQLDPCAVLVADGRDDHLARLARSAWRPVDRLTGWTVVAAQRPAAPRPVPPARPDGIFYVGFTSGSAGRPKAFARTHRSWWESFERFAEVCPPAPRGPVVSPGPLSSSHFLFGALHGLHCGAGVEVTPAADQGAGALARRVADGEAPSALYVVPTMLARLAASPCGDAADPAYIFCVGARLESAVAAAARRRFPGSRLVEYYGASELSFVTIRDHGDAAPPGTVGRAFPGVEVSIRGDGDEPLPPGREGTIFVRSGLVFAGYRGVAPTGAARAIEGGWLTAGDRGALDADGHLRVAGRGSSLIIRGGANVQPEEVEEVVAAAAGVAACVVVGLPDEAWGEVPVAAVLAEPGAALTRAALRAHVAASLARHKRPRRYVLLDDPPPLGRTGKVDRAAVRATVEAAPPEREIR